MVGWDRWGVVDSWQGVGEGTVDCYYLIVFFFFLCFYFLVSHVLSLV